MTVPRSRRAAAAIPGRDRARAANLATTPPSGNAEPATRGPADAPGGAPRRGYVEIKHALADIALGALDDPGRARVAVALAAYARLGRGGPAALTALAREAGETPEAVSTALRSTGFFEAAAPRGAVSLAESCRPHAAYVLRQTARMAVALRLARAAAPAGTARAVRFGCALFNAGLFFECHEYLEEPWRRAPAPERAFYHGLIQAAAACYHMEKGSVHGARVLAAKAAEKLRAFAPAFANVDVAALLRGLASVRAAAEAVPPRLPRGRADLPTIAYAADRPRGGVRAGP